MKIIIKYLSFFTFLTIAIMLALGFFNTAHSFCPYSVICFAGAFFKKQTGNFLFVYASLTGLTIAISTIFIGRYFCGWICPLGTIQDLIFKLNKSKNKNIPLALHKFLLKFKYIIFAFTLVCSYFWLQYMYINFCPVYNITYIKGISIIGIFGLLLFFVPSFFINRFWCRYLCPYAAFMNIFAYIGKLLKIKRLKIFRNIETCCECNLCNKICPMQIDILNTEIVDDVNCIKCKLCCNKCPKKGTLSSKFYK